MYDTCHYRRHRVFSFKLSCVKQLQVKGSLFVFGDGDCGQLGLGEDITEKLRPFPLDIEGKALVQVACGGMHTVALASDGTVY